MTSSSNNWAYLAQNFRKQSNSRQDSFIAVLCPVLRVKAPVKSFVKGMARVCTENWLSIFNFLHLEAVID